MIFKRALNLLAAGAAMAAAAVVGVVAAAFALYALTKPFVGPAGAAAIVAACAAIPALILSATLFAKARAKPKEEEPPSITGRLMEMGREHPLIAAGAVAAAAVLAVRNPRILTLVLTTMLAQAPAGPPKRKR